MNSKAITGRYRRARSLFWTLVAFGALIHIQLFFRYGYNMETGDPSPWPFLIQLPLLMAEHLWLATLAAVIVWLLGRDARVIVVSAGMLLLIGAYLLVNEVYFGLFNDHMSLSASEGELTGIATLWDSFVSELSGWSLINAVALLCALGWLMRRSAVPEDKPAHWSEHPHLVMPLVLWFILGFAAPVAEEHNYVQLNYLSALWRTSPNKAPEVEQRVDQQSLYSSRHGTYRETELDRRRLQENFQALRANWRDHPNVLLIILESVGSLQLLPGGKLDPDITPFLAAQQHRMQVFDNLYAPFPSTARSHIPLLTGGNNITWGSVYDEFKHEYTGPTLVQHYADLDYATGFYSSGDLEYENRMAFYKHLPFDSLFGYNSLSTAERERHGLNSWGVHEAYAWDRATTWLAGIKPPFFLHYMTVSSHHPYSYPNTLKPPLRGENRLERYRNTLYYADTLIQGMFEDLQSRGLLDNTLIAITGDHGQAFGVRHHGNYTHKNRLYEENLRTFLLLIDPREASKLSQHSSGRPGTLGDIAPTLMALQNEELHFYPSQNLFSANYQTRLNFFHKSANPPQWGVRDGNWKYINLIRGNQPELYDLHVDPEESVNLAAQYADRVNAYNGLAAQWFLDSNHRFRAQLQDYHGLGDRALTIVDFQSEGPKAMDFVIRQDGSNTSKPVFKPEDRIRAWTRWVPYAEDKVIDYYWISPGEQHIYAKQFTLQQGWSSTWVPIPAERPLESGIWSLRLKLDGKLLIASSFQVEASDP